MRCLILIIFTTLLLCACGGVKHTTTTAGYPRPGKANTFSYKKKGFRLTGNIIDTSVVYCYAYPADSPEYFNCYRFFATGQVMCYSFYNQTIPFSIDSFANSKSGNVGYYHVEDSIVRLEILFGYPGFKSDGSGRGQIDNSYGIIDGTGIRFFVSHIGKGYHAGRLLKYKWCKQLKGSTHTFLKTNMYPQWFKPDW